MKETKIVEAIGNVDDRYIKEAVTYRAKKQKLHTGLMSFVAAAAVLFLVLGMGMFRNEVKANSVISIDINPSIEITVNKHDKVIAANALNEDAQIVLQGMDLKNVDLDIALNAIIGSLLKNGYLDEVYNVVNVCVENDDEERAGQLGDMVSGEISSLFDEKDLIGGVNTQLCTRDDENKKLADSYGVSVGKLNLAQEVSANLGISLDVAVSLSIPELWDLLDAEGVELITKADALKLVIEDAKIVEADITASSVKIQETGGVYMYAISVTVGQNYQYLYKIDAVNGTIIECEYKYVTEDDTTDEDASTEESTESNDASSKESTESSDASSEESTESSDASSEESTESSDASSEESTESSDASSEESTESSDASSEESTESSDASSEESTDSSVEEDASSESTEEQEPEKPVKQLTKKEALAIAYEDAEIDAASAKLEVLKHKPKEKEYHIEFSVGLCDYSYIISAVDGTIIRKEVIDKTGAGNLTGEIISVDKALELALNKVGVKLADLTKCDIKYTNKKEGAEYKIHFHVDKDHYEYIVNALTGEVSEKEKPVPPHEKEKPAKPAPAPKPHEKEEAAKPAPKPHEKEKPVPPHEKEKPLGPEDSKITITFE